tara:strand:+ start:1637 stop:2656 length:1020 start_codon:yes stop_codon:yes gene_type:complete
MDLGSVELVQLPPTHAKVGDYSTLYTEGGSVVDDEWRARRTAELLNVFERVHPRVLVTELFPFGRRQMQFELVPLLDAALAADPRPIVVSSVRDILVGQDRPGRAERVCDQLQTYFDHVLVHADPRFVALDATFPLVSRIKRLVTYTGYIAEHSGGDSPEQPTGEVLVSAGSGAAGQQLIETALTCRHLTPLRDHTWRVLVGSRGAYEDLNGRLGEFGDGVIIEPARSDFPALLRGCALSISQGGYNTVVETLQAGARAVIVPYAGGNETEQAMRAELMARRGVIETVSESDLSQETLAASVNAALGSSRDIPVIDLSGAEVTAQLLHVWATGPGEAGS